MQRKEVNQEPEQVIVLPLDKKDPVKLTTSKEIKEKETLAREKEIIARTDLAAIAVESADIGAIFGMFFKEASHLFLESLGKFFLFPAAAAAAWARVALAWRQVHLEKGKQTGSIVKGVIETVSASAITVGVALGLVLGSVAAPIIFTVVLTAKAAFHAASTVFYLWQYFKTDDPKEKEECYKKIRDNTVATITFFCFAVATATVMLFTKTTLALVGTLNPFAAIGLAGGLIGMLYSLYKQSEVGQMKAGSGKEIRHDNSDDPPSPPPPGNGKEPRNGKSLTSTAKTQKNNRSSMVVGEEDKKEFDNMGNEGAKPLTKSIIEKKTAMIEQQRGNGKEPENGKSLTSTAQKQETITEEDKKEFDDMANGGAQSLTRSAINQAIVAVQQNVIAPSNSTSVIVSSLNSNINNKLSVITQQINEVDQRMTEVRQAKDDEIKQQKLKEADYKIDYIDKQLTDLEAQMNPNPAVTPVIDQNRPTTNSPTARVDKLQEAVDKAESCIRALEMRKSPNNTQ